VHEGKARHGTARQSWTCAIFKKHLPQVPRPGGDRGTEGDLRFHLNFVTLWMKVTFRKFVK